MQGEKCTIRMYSSLLPAEIIGIKMIATLWKSKAISQNSMIY